MTDRYDWQLVFQDDFLFRHMVCHWLTERRIKNTFPHVLYIIQLCTHVSAGSVTGDKVQTLQIFNPTICDSDP